MKDEEITVKCRACGRTHKTTRLHASHVCDDAFCGGTCDYVELADARKDYKYLGKKHHPDLSPLHQVPMCCDFCKIKWLGQLSQSCDCGTLANKTYEAANVI